MVINFYYNMQYQLFNTLCFIFVLFTHYVRIHMFSYVLVTEWSIFGEIDVNPTYDMFFCT